VRAAAFGVGSGFEVPAGPKRCAANQGAAVSRQPPPWVRDLQGTVLRIIEIHLFRLFVMLSG
jgi:hypothetical protein